MGSVNSDGTIHLTPAEDEPHWGDINRALSIRKDFLIMLLCILVTSLYDILGESQLPMENSYVSATEMLGITLLSSVSACESTFC